MYFEMLLKLAPDIGEERTESLDKYLGEEIALKASGNIMIPISARKLSISNADALAILEKCRTIGLVEKRFLLRCPNCRTPIRTVTTNELAHMLKEPHYCPKCENEDMDVDTDDFEVYYVLVAEKPSFPSGQQAFQVHNAAQACKPDLLTGNQETMGLQGLSLKEYLDAGFNIDDAFYSPSDEDYVQLEAMYKLVCTPTTNSTEKGKCLERLVIKIFSLSKEFCVYVASDSVHQIDALPSRKYSLHTATNALGHNFIIECKNEKEKPITDYFTKLHSRVIEFRASKDPDSFKTGILVSRKPAPDTYPTWATINYGKQGVYILSMSDEHIKRIVYQKENLYSILRELMLMVQTGLDKIMVG